MEETKRCRGDSLESAIWVNSIHHVMPSIERNNPNLNRSKRFDRVILHIGTEKTGTKAIQHHLHKNRDRLAENGILYPKIEGSVHASQWEFVAAVHDKPWMQDVGRHFGITNDDERTAFRDRLSIGLERQFNRHFDCRTLILSSEHFQSRLDIPSRISALRDYLSEWSDNFQVVVYFRRQDQLALSFLSTRLKSSVVIEQESMLEAMNSIPRYYDYLELYKNWAGIFGTENIVARLYCPSRWPDQEITTDFCRACGIPVMQGESQRLNVSLNRKGFQFLRALNAKYPIVPGDKSDKERAALVEYISDRYRGKFYPISREQAMQFYAPYIEQNEVLRRMAFSHLEGPIFEEDFSEYPETAEQLSMEYPEAVELIVNLWRDKITGSPKGGPIQTKIGEWLSRISGS